MFRLPARFLPAAYGLTAAGAATAVAADEATGGLVGTAVTLDAGGAGSAARLTVDHWSLAPNGDEASVPVVALTFDRPFDPNRAEELTLIGASVLGQTIDLADDATAIRLQQAVRELAEGARAGRQPDTLAVLRRAGLAAEGASLAGLNAEGQPAFSALQRAAPGGLSLPRRFADAAFGTGGPAESLSATATRAESGETYAAEAALTAGADGTAVRIDLSRLVSPAGPQTAEAAALRAVADPARPGYLTITELRVAGRDALAGGRAAQAGALGAIRDQLAALRRGEMPDLVAAVGEHGLADLISPIADPPSLEAGGRTTLRVQGGNNVQSFLGGDEAKIGGNGYVYTHEGKRPDGTIDRQSVIVDMGIMYADKKKTGYDGVMPSFASHFRHRSKADHQPQTDCQAILITHPHQDHIGAIVHHVKAGYMLPPIVCSAVGKRYIRNELMKYGIDKAEWPDFKVVKPRELLEFGRLKVETAAMSHSMPGIAFLITTPNGSVLSPGDVKLDQTTKAGAPTDIPFLNDRQIDVLVMDSTSSTAPGHTPTEQSIADNTLEVFEQNADKRFIVSMIGSNANRLMSLLEAAGRSGRNVTADGASVEFLMTALNNEGINPEVMNPTGGRVLKRWLQQTYGVEMVGRTSKLGQEIVNGEGFAGSQLLLTTGTQDEDMSGLNRIVRGNHPRIKGDPARDVILISQRPIPGSEKGYWNAVKLARKRGFTVITPSEWEAEHGKPLHASGHPHEQEVVDFVKAAKPGTVIPIHGGPAQLQRNAEVIRQAGAPSFFVTNQDVVQIERGQAPKILGQRAENWIYVKNIRPEGQYWGGDVEYAHYRAPPLLRDDSSPALALSARASGLTSAAAQPAAVEPVATTEPAPEVPPPNRRRRYAGGLKLGA